MKTKEELMKHIEISLKDFECYSFKAYNNDKKKWFLLDEPLDSTQLKRMIKNSIKLKKGEKTK